MKALLGFDIPADVDVFRRASLRSVVFPLKLVALAFFDKGHQFPWHAAQQSREAKIKMSGAPTTKKIS